MSWKNKARNKEIKKRSKIIKEVNQDNEEEILRKILKKKRQLEEDEENKVINISKSSKKVIFQIPSELNFLI